MLAFVLDSNNIPQLINAFFLFSFLGWAMECVVIRREKGFWENRGFAKLPFCIIYGFGAMIGYAVLRPFSFNWVVLFVAGAVVATCFEYLTARLMLRVFGTIWWDYTKKPLNYKGLLCLESTLGWGVIAILLFAGLHSSVLGVVASLPNNVASALSFVLVCSYVADFALSLRRSLQGHSDAQQENIIQKEVVE